MIREFLKKNKYFYIFYRKFIFPYFLRQEKEILFLRNFNFDISIDIGANVGTYTLELQKNSKKVICFEPVKKNINYLKLLIEKKTILYNYALGNKNEFNFIYIPKLNNKFDYALSSLKVENFKKKIKKKIKIIQKKFDNLHSNVIQKKIDFIKIDVEGYELNILEGMKNFLEYNKPIFLIEIEKKHNLQYEKVFNFLKKRKYDSFILNSYNQLVQINKFEFKKIIVKKKENNFFFI